MPHSEGLKNSTHMSISVLLILQYYRLESPIARLSDDVNIY